MEVKTLFILGGGGLMGSGIAQTFVEAGFNVIVHDVKDEFVQRGMTGIENQLERKVTKGKLTPDQKSTILARLKPSTDMANAKGADVVIEAIFEDMELKKRIFAQLDEICPPHTILASNTSCLAITPLGGATKRPDKVIGMHFIQPVPIMPLTNITKGLLTSDDTFDTIAKLGAALGKKVLVWPDGTGHGGQVPAMSYYNEAIKTLSEGRGTAEDIDKCFKMGMGMAMGPISTVDFIGLDTTLHILEACYEAYGGSELHPCQLAVQMVSAGLCGTKSGRGFYTYS